MIIQNSCHSNHNFFLMSHSIGYKLVIAFWGNKGHFLSPLNSTTLFLFSLLPEPHSLPGKYTDFADVLGEEETLLIGQ